MWGEEEEEEEEGGGVDRPSRLCVTELRTEAPEGPRCWTGVRGRLVTHFSG